MLLAPQRCLVLLGLSALATAQNISITSQTFSRVSTNTSQQIVLDIDYHDSPGLLALIPLVSLAQKLPASGVTGTLLNTNNAQLNGQNNYGARIALVDCDDDDYMGNMNSADALTAAVSGKAMAIILFTIKDGSCNLTNADPNYNFLYAMENGANSTAVINLVNRAQGNVVFAHINHRDNAAASNGNNSGGTPSTAVAMIILYSITGVITALFLIIIVAGAIRAHRHPERYGPRAVLGRARQSRAKGLARAMLESIPIVKFGEEEGEPQKSGDVELAPGQSTTNDGAPDVSQERKSTDSAQRTTTEEAARSATPRKSIESGIGADVTTVSAKPAARPEETLQCSICTEDFERGEDVRVLPCDHKFHPACIDPWLLNVSGTCPLCRIDLRPPTAEGTESDLSTSDSPGAATSSNAESSGLPSASSRRQSRRLSQFIFDPLNRRRMQEASPEERILALRQYRQGTRNEATGAIPESRRTRLSRRFSNPFGNPNRVVAPAPDSVPEADPSSATRSPSPPAQHEGSASSEAVPTSGGVSQAGENDTAGPSNPSR